MARQRTGTASKSSAKPSPRQSAGPVSFTNWQNQAAAVLERNHGVRGGIVPTRIWSKLYILNLSPEEAADRAAVAARNARPTADRLGRRGRRR